MSGEHADLYYPSANFYADGMHVTVNSQENMLQRGMDPKPLILDYCKPQCVYWKEKLERCESMLEFVIKTNPTKSCLYPFRDWATCVEACVSIRSYFLADLVMIGYRHNQWFTINWRAHSANLTKFYERKVAGSNNRQKCGVTDLKNRPLCMYI